MTRVIAVWVGEHETVTARLERDGHAFDVTGSASWWGDLGVNVRHAVAEYRGRQAEGLAFFPKNMTPGGTL